VTKFVAESYECFDRNGDTIIQTSHGPSDVLPWGEDECMAWNTTLPPGSAGGMAMGCRATAWQGDEDADTGLGGHVWIGCMMNQRVYVLDGETGEVLNGPDGAVAGVGPYGGAMDGLGHFWMVAMGCTVGPCRLSEMDLVTYETTIHTVPCGYGISVDRYGRVWTAGLGCVNRLDPVSDTSTTLHTGASFNRGIAVDDLGSVWAAVTTGDVLRVSESDVTLVNQFHVGPEAVVGVAIDFQHNVWAVSQGGNAALKIDPDTYEVESFRIGSGPYTYSDMTGYQLSIVEIPY
jgi:streptogramin lyase